MIMPYLRFNGNCEEAFLWYAKIFKGKVQHLLKYRDLPENPDQPLNMELRNKVVHAQVMLTTNGGISGSDNLDHLDVASQSEMFIQAHLDTIDLAKYVFVALENQGLVISKLATNPSPDDSGISGCVKDKYGITWIISAMK